jgi:UDP-N-acetylglucosamine--N-acetylmuramyl-(pentapeptide) pyrophosphoryl-undecaprenol N-acetylglucosamine transferase
MTLRILLTGGGTGGHIYPLLAVSDALRKKTAEASIPLELYYLGAPGDYAELLRSAGCTVRTLFSAKLRRYAALHNLIDIPKFFLSFLQALWQLYSIMPDAVFSKGGPGALPVILAAWWYRIPVMLHESDAIPGLTTILGRPFARRVAVSYPSAQAYFPASKVVCTGVPLREALFSLVTSKEDAKKALGFDPSRPLLFISGGSQGAQVLNEIIILALKDILPLTQILHQTGKANFTDTESLAHTALLDLPERDVIGTRYKPLPYLDDDLMRLALAASDLALARSGSSIFELVAFRIPLILVPLASSARDHQMANARAFADQGGAILIEEENLSVPILTHAVRDILTNEAKRNALITGAASLAPQGAADLVADELLALV